MIPGPGGHSPGLDYPEGFYRYHHDFPDDARPLAINTSTFVGLQIAGIPGAVAATLGCIIPGVAAALLLHLFFQRHKKSAYVSGVLEGLKAASVGLIMVRGRHHPAADLLRHL